METIRKRIDQIDQEIVTLLEQRMQAVEKVVGIKKTEHRQVLDESREQAVLEKVKQSITDQKFAPCILAVYDEILKSSKEYQEKQM